MAISRGSAGSARRSCARMRSRARSGRKPSAPWARRGCRKSGPFRSPHRLPAAARAGPRSRAAWRSPRPPRSPSPRYARNASARRRARICSARSSPASRSSNRSACARRLRCGRCSRSSCSSWISTRRSRTRRSRWPRSGRISMRARCSHRSLRRRPPPARSSMKAHAARTYAAARSWRPAARSRSAAIPSACVCRSTRSRCSRAPSSPRSRNGNRPISATRRSYTERCRSC